MMLDMPTAAAYLRRSSADEERPGLDSRGRQEAAVRRLCGADVVLYVDWGISGSGNGAKRPEYQRLKADIAAGRITSVCAESLTRLGRNTRELLDFMALCQAHSVQVQTDKERVDTSGAMGRFLFTIMAAIGELELEMGKERSAGARMAKAARYEAAGLPMPGTLALYGKRNVTIDKLTRVISDPDRPIEPILAAYREAGSIRGATALLQARGVPAPKGGKLWGSTTLRRILTAYEREGLVDLPDVMTERAGRRPVRNNAALFAGLLRCYCGHTMTPNVARHQYFCAAGRDSGLAIHGSYTVSERSLRRALEPIAALYQRRLVVQHKAEASVAKSSERLNKAKERWLLAYTSGAIPEARWKAETARADAELANLARQAKGVLQLYHEAIPSWDDIPAMNRHLRTIWRVVQLDSDRVPLPPEWAIPPDLYGVSVADDVVAEVMEQTKVAVSEWVERRADRDAEREAASARREADIERAHKPEAPDDLPF